MDGINIRLQHGEVLGVVGESASGKSVTIDGYNGSGAISALPRVSGEVILNGTDLLRASARTLRCMRGRDISMVSQDPMASLNPVLMVGASDH